MKEHPGYYAVIPADVRYDETISASEKLMFGEITALTQVNGKCWASPDYFANLYGKHSDTISRWTSNLEKAGYIDVTKTPQGRRYITIANPRGKNASRVETQEAKTPRGKNASYNNTSNNDVNNIKALSDCTEYEPSKRVVKRFNEWTDNVQLKHKISKIKTLTEKRASQLKTRQKEGFMIDEIIYHLSEATDWLNGWPNFSFDWLLANDTNWVKVVEGKFRNKGGMNSHHFKQKIEAEPGKYDHLESERIEA